MNGHTNPLYGLPYASARSRLMIVMSNTLMGICKEWRSGGILTSVGREEGQRSAGMC